ncbi:MAG: hypothetical protein AAB929_00620, partial [Patescibacteria group bacterium]
MFKTQPSSFLTRLSLRAKQIMAKQSLWILRLPRRPPNRRTPRNDMRRRLIIFFLIISPFLYILFIGYPIKKTAPLPGQSSRCFKIGELKEFVECYREGRRLEG